MEKYETLKRKKDAKIREKGRNISVAKQNDMYYHDLLQPEIDSLIDKLYQIRWNECRYEFCDYKLSDLREHIWTAIHISHRGKFRQAYYFCSRGHWNIIRGRCGLKTNIPTGQLTISQASK